MGKELPPLKSESRKMSKLTMMKGEQRPRTAHCRAECMLIPLPSMLTP